MENEQPQPGSSSNTIVTVAPKEKLWISYKKLINMNLILSLYYQGEYDIANRLKINKSTKNNYLAILNQNKKAQRAFFLKEIAAKKIKKHPRKKNNLKTIIELQPGEWNKIEREELKLFHVLSRWYKTMTKEQIAESLHISLEVVEQYFLIASLEPQEIKDYLDKNNEENDKILKEQAAEERQEAARIRMQAKQQEIERFKRQAEELEAARVRIQAEKLRVKKIKRQEAKLFKRQAQELEAARIRMQAEPQEKTIGNTFTTISETAPPNNELIGNTEQKPPNSNELSFNPELLTGMLDAFPQLSNLIDHVKWKITRNPFPPSAMEEPLTSIFTKEKESLLPLNYSDEINDSLETQEEATISNAYFSEF